MNNAQLDKQLNQIIEEAEQITFGKATRTSPLTIKQVKYKPDGMPDTIKFFATFAECKRANTKRRAEN